MKFEVKVLSEESLKRINMFINEMIEYELKGKEMEEGRKSFLRRFEEIKWRDALQYMWNGKGEKIKAALEKELKSEELTDEERITLKHVINPETTVEVYKDERVGMQNQPRIMWKGEIKKVEEIDEIISYTTK